MRGSNKGQYDTAIRPLFHPTFGSRPAQIVGRDQVLEEYLEGLHAPIGSRNRCTFLIGQRGMGKTALLLEMADLARENDMIPAVVTAYEGMNEEILELIQREGEAVLPKESKSIQGFEAGALGFSFGLTFNDVTQNHYGFRTKLTVLSEALEKCGKGIVLLVDETMNSEAMRQLGITYQHLVGENRDIAIVMAGLPQAVSSVLNDRVLTFLNRAHKVKLGPIGLLEIRAYYEQAFRQTGIGIRPELLETAVRATEGYPYLMQLIGFYLLQSVKENNVIEKTDLEKSIQKAREDLAQSVFAPILSPLSDGDRAFLAAMAEDESISRMADIGKRLEKENSYLQPYRARMIEAGIIESPRKGEVVFTIPHLAEYLRQERLDTK